MHRRFPLAFLARFAALSAIGCGPASQPTAQADDQDVNGTAFRVERVTWNRYGVIDPRWAIEGQWYSYSDCEREEGVALDLPCTQRDPELVGPDGSKGWATSAKQVCMKGTVPRVELDRDDSAYDFQWGAGMGFQLGGRSTDETYDADAHGITGFMFDITQGTSGSQAPSTLRISLPTAATETSGHFITVAPPSLDQRVMFDEVEQGIWVMVPTEFRPQTIRRVNFDVSTNIQAPRDYDFCVSNFRVICPAGCTQ
jgi:hypothetical protein